MRAVIIPSAAVKIAADRYIPGIVDAFGNEAEVMLCEPESIQNARLHDCDALLVRTVTRVDAALLQDTPVRFVATATSGCDHIDTDYLAAQRIGFATAAGCNARPVAEYVLSALAVLCEQDARQLTDLSVGIIGCGHVGSRLAAMLQSLGVTVLLNDPPLAAQGDPRAFDDLDTLLSQADVVTLHVPFEDTGDHPTVNLLDAERLCQLRPGAVLINTARGGVIDEAALKQVIPERGLRAVLDVWCNEPAIDSALAARVELGTPHIAGYSLAAKLRASAQVCRAVSDYFALTVEAPVVANGPGEPRLLSLTAAPFAEQARLAILAGYDIRGDAAALARSLRLPAGERPGYFTDLRRQYRLRREFSSLILKGADVMHADRWRALGFRLEQTASEQDGTD